MDTLFFNTAANLPSVFPADPSSAPPIGSNTEDVGINTAIPESTFGARSLANARV